MIISVDDGLRDIKDELENLGYETYYFSNKKISDVYIYSQSSLGLADLYNSIIPTDSGSFIINADVLSIEEINRCINKRTYTPIFK